MSFLRGNLGQSQRLLALCALVLAVAACKTKTPQASPPPLGERSSSYVLKPGDYLDVRFYKTPELNVEVPVRADGRISLPPFGDVQAAGLEPATLEKKLARLYSKELTDPRITVIVRGFGGQVFVGGEVKTPMIVPLTADMTALQAIDGAGGFLNTADRDSVVLLRREGAAYQGYTLTLDKALTGENLSADVALRPTDIIHVPRTRVGNMNLFVEQYIRNNLPIQPSMGFGAF